MAGIQNFVHFKNTFKTVGKETGEVIIRHHLIITQDNMCLEESSSALGLIIEYSK